MICFQNCIFEISETPYVKNKVLEGIVVICFQNCIFEISETPLGDWVVRHHALWFAFKIVSLKYRKHRNPFSRGFTGVVICFQNCIFEISETPKAFKVSDFYLLWFAFKIVSLKYRKHLALPKVGCLSGCDLLSKLYLWNIGNTQQMDMSAVECVVICFQNCIFEISETPWHTYHVVYQRIRVKIRK